MMHIKVPKCINTLNGAGVTLTAAFGLKIMDSCYSQEEVVSRKHALKVSTGQTSHIIISKQEDNLRMMVKKMIEIHKETGTQLNPCEDKHNYTSVCLMISKQENNMISKQVNDLRKISL